MLVNLLIYISTIKGTLCRTRIPCSYIDKTYINVYKHKIVNCNTNIIHNSCHSKRVTLYYYINYC